MHNPPLTSTIFRSRIVVATMARPSDIASKGKGEGSFSPLAVLLNPKPRYKQKGVINDSPTLAKQMRSMTPGFSAYTKILQFDLFVKADKENYKVGSL